MRKWILSVVGLLVVLSVGLTACTQEKNLTIYSGREETLVSPIIEQFQKATGISVAVKYGSSSALALTILEEGGNTPADIYYGSDPGSLGTLSHLFTRLPDGILSQVSESLRSPEGRWVGLSGRARVIVYNTEKVTPEDLPDSIFGFTDPMWKGRIGWAPTNGSFQSMVTAMRLLWGEQKTRQWLEGIQANSPKVYPKNTPIVAATGAGEIDVGFVNHYYLHRFLQEQGESFPARNYYLKGGDPGATMLISGAGILATSKNKEAAEQFLEFMLSTVSQQYFASQTFEYPLLEGVKTHRELVPLSQIELPAIDLSRLTDIEGTLELLRETGVLP